MIENKQTLLNCWGNLATLCCILPATKGPTWLSGDFQAQV